MFHLSIQGAGPKNGWRPQICLFFSQDRPDSPYSLSHISLNDSDVLQNFIRPRKFQKNYKIHKIYQNHRCRVLQFIFIFSEIEISVKECSNSVKIV